MLDGDSRKCPRRGLVLRANLPGRDGAPDPCQRQQDITRIALDVPHELVDAADHCGGEVVVRDRVEQLGRGRTDEWAVPEQHHRKQNGHVSVRILRPGLEVPALEVVAETLAVPEVEPRRGAPGPSP